MRRRAIIDVGTNSVKLLIAQVQGSQVQPLFETSEQTRLGRGFFTHHQLQPEAVAQTARAVGTFARAAREWKAESLRILATSAARDAVNQDELIGAIQKTCGLPLEIISGEQEAEWAFQGVATDPRFVGRPILLVDVGGGSTQLVAGRDRECRFRHSYRMGTVRLYERIRPSDPPHPEEEKQTEQELAQFLELKVLPDLRPVFQVWPADRMALVGTGGTASLLATMHEGLSAFDRQRIESVVLSRAYLRRHRNRLWQLTLEERRQIRGLPPKKADVILTGIALYVAVLERLAQDNLHVSTRSFRFGALAERG